jgi:hypothetical protein
VAGSRREYLVADKPKIYITVKLSSVTRIGAGCGERNEGWTVPKLPQKSKTEHLEISFVSGLSMLTADRRHLKTYTGMRAAFPVEMEASFTQTKTE